MEELIIHELRLLQKAVLLKGKEVLNLQEVSIYTGFSIDHLHKLTQSGKLTHYKPGGKSCFVHIDDLKKYLLQNKVGSISDSQEIVFNHLLNTTF
jgi:excisionase family DNA binding protein